MNMYIGPGLVFFIASYEPVPEDQIQFVLNVWSWDQLHNLDKQGLSSWGLKTIFTLRQPGMDQQSQMPGQAQGHKIDLVRT